MKLVWHLFRKDLTRVKPFAAALLLLVTLRPLLGVFALTRPTFDYDDATRFENIDSLLQTAHLVGAWLLTLWLAQLDSPRRPDAFLHTRPVSRRALWSAKLLGALALCAFAPLLAFLPWWLGCGMAGAELRALLVGHVGGPALIVVSALTVGALFRDYRRAVLCSIVVAVVAACLGVLSTHPGESPWRPFLDRDFVLRVGAWVLLGAAAIFALLGLLYRRHPRWPGFVAWAAATFALGAAFRQTDWPAPLPPPPPRDPLANAPAVTEPKRETDARNAWKEDNAAAFPDLRVDLTSLRRRSPNRDSRPIYTMTALATGTNGLLPHVEVGSIRFTSPNGDSVRFEGGTLWSYPDHSPLFAPHSEPTPQTYPAFAKLVCDWNHQRAMRLESLSPPLTVRADLRITLYRPALVSRLPLEPNGWRHKLGGGGYSIRSIQERTEGTPGIELEMTQTDFDSSGIRNLWRWLDRPRNAWTGLDGVFDAQGRSVGEKYIHGGGRYTVAGVKVSHITQLLEMPPIKGPDGKWTTPAPTPEWREGLSYAAIELAPVARLRRELVATDITVERRE